MKKKNFIIPIIVLIIGAMMISIGIFAINHNKNSSNSNDFSNTFDISEEVNVDMCLKDVTCEIPYVKLYYIDLGENIRELKKIISNINKTTKEEYEKVIASNVSDSNCATISNKYTHSYVSTIDYDLYQGKDFITIKIARTKQNLCTNDIVHDKPEIYIYSVNDKKIITAKEMEKRLNIDPNKIELAIRRNIFTTNKLNNTAYTYENTYVNGKRKLEFYYSYDKTLYAIYYQAEAKRYYETEIK